MKAMGKGRDLAGTPSGVVHLPFHHMRDGMRQTGEMLLLDPLLFPAPLGSGKLALVLTRCCPGSFAPLQTAPWGGGFIKTQPKEPAVNPM